MRSVLLRLGRRALRAHTSVKLPPREPQRRSPEEGRRDTHQAGRVRAAVPWEGKGL